MPRTSALANFALSPVTKKKCFITLTPGHLKVIDNSFNQGKITEGTVDLVVLTSLDQLIFKVKIFLTFVTKQATLMRRSTVLSLSLQLLFPALTRQLKSQ